MFVLIPGMIPICFSNIHCRTFAGLLIEMMNYILHKSLHIVIKCNKFFLNRSDCKPWGTVAWVATRDSGASATCSCYVPKYRLAYSEDLWHLPTFSTALGGIAWAGMNGGHGVWRANFHTISNEYAVLIVKRYAAHYKHIDTIFVGQENLKVNTWEVFSITMNVFNKKTLFSRALNRYPVFPNRNLYTYQYQCLSWLTNMSVSVKHIFLFWALCRIVSLGVRMLSVSG